MWVRTLFKFRDPHPLVLFTEDFNNFFSTQKIAWTDQTLSFKFRDPHPLVLFTEDFNNFFSTQKIAWTHQTLSQFDQ